MLLGSISCVLVRSCICIEYICRSMCLITEYNPKAETWKANLQTHTNIQQISGQLVFQAKKLAWEHYVMKEVFSARIRKNAQMVVLGKL
jgi:hypothetical protein